MHQIPAIFPDLCALLWPVQCVGCGIPDRACCSQCLQEFRESAKSRAARSFPHTERASNLRVEAALPYAGTARAMLVAMKHAGRMQFLPPLGAAIAEPIGRLCARRSPVARLRQPTYVVTMPSSRASVRKRGFRHLEVLAHRALRELRDDADCEAVTLCRGALVPGEGRRTQVGLSASARETNAARIELRRTARSLLEGQPVIIVDDIVTTGASLRAAHTVLSAYGVQVVGAAALCWVPRKDES